MAKKRTLIIKTADSLGGGIERAVSGVNPNLTPANVDTVARAYANLTKNTYQDTIIQDVESVNEALAEE